MPAPLRGLRLALSAAVLATALGAGAQDAGSHFDAGVAAFRAGDTPGALAEFQRAQAGGLDIPQLHFNLGLSYYRLERYPEARAAFERLAQFPDYRYIADFHLGLVAARAGRRDEAEALWRAVERDAPQAALRERAQVARQRLRGPAASGYALLTFGHDSNPALLEETLLPAGAGSALQELIAVFDVPLGGAALEGGAYLREYADAPGLDQHTFFAGIAAERRGEDQRRLGLEFSASELDGERFTDTFALGYESRPLSGRAGTTRRAQLARIGTGDAYRHLEGWRLRIEAERSSDREAARVRSGMQLEFNDRADLESGAEFFSHSPLRGRFSLSVGHPVAQSWDLNWSARFRHSFYREADRFLDGGQLREERRAESLFQAGLQARRRLGESTGWLLEYQYSLNSSSIDAFGYERHLLLTGLDWAPRAD